MLTKPQFKSGKVGVCSGLHLSGVRQGGLAPLSDRCTGTDTANPMPSSAAAAGLLADACLRPAANPCWPAFWHAALCRMRQGPKIAQQMHAGCASHLNGCLVQHRDAVPQDVACSHQQPVSLQSQICCIACNGCHAAVPCGSACGGGRKCSGLGMSHPTMPSFSQTPDRRQQKLGPWYMRMSRQLLTHRGPCTMDIWFRSGQCTRGCHQRTLRRLHQNGPLPDAKVRLRANASQPCSRYHVHHHNPMFVHSTRQI